MRNPSPPHHVLPDTLHTSLQATRDTPPTRPPCGTTVSHKRRLEPRVGSPTCWAPRLVVQPSVHETTRGAAAFFHNYLKRSSARRALRSPSLRLLALVLTHPLKSGSPLSPHYSIRAGKVHWGFHTLGKSYSAPLNPKPPSVRYTVTVDTPVFQRAKERKKSLTMRAC